MTKWVGQLDSNGCGIACLAMIVGKSYEEVRSEVRYYDGSGLHDHIIDSYLADNGFAVARKHEVCHWAQEKYGRKRREKWPPEPFADVHLVMVESCMEPYRTHYLVMLRDGTTLDPLVDPSQFGVHGLTYPRVLSVTGVWHEVCA